MNIKEAAILKTKATQSDILSDATPFAGAAISNLIATVSTGTFTLQNLITEQDLLEFAVATQDIDLELDVNTLTQSTTIREYSKVDGTTYRQISAKVFPTDFDSESKAISISFKQKNITYKITIQSSVLEGATRDIPYNYRTEDKI